MASQLAPFFADFSFLNRIKQCNKTCHKCGLEFKAGDKIKAIGKLDYRKYYHADTCYKEY